MLRHYRRRYDVDGSRKERSKTITHKTTFCGRGGTGGNYFTDAAGVRDNKYPKTLKLS